MNEIHDQHNLGVTQLCWSYLATDGPWWLLYNRNGFHGIFTACKRSNVFIHACPSVHSGGGCLHAGIHTPGQTPSGQTPPWADTVPLGRYPSPGQTPHSWILRDAVYKRVVRILLECILVMQWLVSFPSMWPVKAKFTCFSKESLPVLVKAKLPVYLVKTRTFLIILLLALFCSNRSLTL